MRRRLPALLVCLAISGNAAGQSPVKPFTYIPFEATGPLAPGEPKIMARGMGFVEGPTIVYMDKGKDGWLGNILVVDKAHPEGVIWDIPHFHTGATGMRPQPWVKVGKPGNTGSAFGPDGWLYVANPREKAVLRARRDASGPKVEWLVHPTETRPLNGPNDLVVRANGDLYFTDSTRGSDLGAVYLRRPPGPVGIVIAGMRTPNGIGLSPDGGTLYIAQSEPNKLVQCEVHDDGVVGLPRPLFTFEEPATPDGMAVGPDGTIYQALYDARAVAAISPDGRERWRVALDWDLEDKSVEGYGVTNCALAPDGLYLTRTHGGGRKDNGCRIYLPLKPQD